MRTVSVALFFLCTALTAPTELASQLCTKMSFAVQGWVVRNFDFHASYTFTAPTHQDSWGYTNFALENPAIPEMALCSASSNQVQYFFYGTVDYKCRLESHNSSTSFRYSYPSGDLKINQNWTCPGESNRFTAHGNIRLELVCHETKWENPNWIRGSIYSQRHIVCDPATDIVPVTKVSGVA